MITKAVGIDITTTPVLELRHSTRSRSARLLDLVFSENKIAARASSDKFVRRFHSAANVKSDHNMRIGFRARHLTGSEHLANCRMRILVQESRTVDKTRALRRWPLLICLYAASLFLSGFAQATTPTNSAGQTPTTKNDPLIIVGAGWYQFDWNTSGEPFDQEGAFTFSSSETTILTVTDSFCPGDQFLIYDYGTPIGDTNPVAINASCPGLSPDVALSNSTYSHGTFVLKPGNHSITLQTITNPFPPGTGYLRVDPFAGSVDLLDPISQLVTSTGAIISDGTSPIFSSTALKTRQGVAADGVSELVLRYNAPSVGMVSFTLVDENGNTLPADPNDNGSLSDLTGSLFSSSQTVSTVSNQGDKAFATYAAPRRFVRQNVTADLSASSRQIFLKTTFYPGGTTLTTPILVVRPPVVLIHGIWSDYTEWDNFPLPSSLACVDSGHFYACRINYSWINADKFAVIAPNVGQRVRNVIANFREAKQVVAVQADAITHSMGGNIVRILPLCGTVFKDCTFQYTSPANLGAGDIHELVTIGTPHRGTPLADRLIQYENASCFAVLGVPTGQGTLASHFADMLHPINQGAVDDLRDDSAAISGMNSTASPFPIHFVVGIASSTDESLVDQGLGKQIDMCNPNIIPGDDVRKVFGSDSDLVVSVASQRNNLNDGATGTTKSTDIEGAGNVIHSFAFAAFNGQAQSAFSPQETSSSALGKAVLLILDMGPFAQ